MQSFKRYRDVAIVIVLLAVPFFFLSANMKDRSKLNVLDRAILRVSAPIEFAASSLARGVSNLWESYVYLVDVKADNERLQYENARLREENHKLQQRESENRDLRRLLQLRESLPGDLVSAQVVGADFHPFFRVKSVVLDRGSRDIRPHMPVLAPEGVVGSVESVDRDKVHVQLAVDPAFNIDVEDERTHARGFVRGINDPTRYAVMVQYVDSLDEVDIGDLLVTTGKGKWRPKGLPVARVTKVVKREPGQHQEIEARPTVDFSRLDSVLILVTPPSENDGAPDKPEKPKSPTASAKSGTQK